AAPEDGLVRARVRDEILELRPGIGAQKYRPGLLPLAEERHLPGLTAAPADPRLEVADPERTQLAHASARCVEEADEEAVPEIRLQRDHAVDLRLGEDPLREPVPDLRRRDRGSHVVDEVSRRLAEGEERLDREEL